jgi:H+-translocating NAD(P) transhydrogenase subunit alpha
VDPLSLAFVFLLAMFLGLELIAKVPSTLHTPLMSGSNAISGITVIGAIVLVGRASDGSQWSALLGAAAIAFAMVNVIGGYLVTDRMLRMFRRKDDQEKGA